MLTLHGNTTSFMIQCTLWMVDESFKNCLHSVTFCWWPAVNKAVYPCDLSRVFVNLLSEYHVQIIDTNFNDKMKVFKVTYILHTIFGECTECDVKN